MFPGISFTIQRSFFHVKKIFPGIPFMKSKMSDKPVTVLMIWVENIVCGSSVSVMAYLRVPN